MTNQNSQQQQRKEMTALRPIKKKIQSERGASITYALLLFLVCAVVGSAVLTAGTAAAGRLSQIAEMDQRYYSVNSAAKLLIDLLEKDTLRVEPSDDEGADYLYYIGDEPVTGSPLTLSLAKQVMQKRDAAEEPVTEPVLEFTLNPTTEDTLDANISVTVKATVSSSGDLVLVLNNTEGSEKYTITLYLMNTGGSSAFKWKLYDIDSKTSSAS